MVGKLDSGQQNICSSRPGTKGFDCGKWFIGYNFGTDHEELIVLNVLKYKYYVEKSRDHFAKNRK